VVRGWTRVNPGQTIKLNSGAGDNVFVLMKNFNNGTVIVPDKKYGDPMSLPVRHTAFGHDSTTPIAGGVVAAPGFYPYPTNMVFTIR
jgi:hypothetical protein